MHRTPRFAQRPWLLLCVLVTALPCVAFPARADQMRLFRDFSLGMSREEVLSRPGAYDCADVLGPHAVCVDQVLFLEQPWDMDFEFSPQGLQNVSLRAPFTPELYTRAFAALDERFELVTLQSDEAPLDLVALWKTAPNSGEASRRMTEYETRGMQRSKLAYVFLERSGVHEALRQAQDVQELLRGARPGTREAGLVLSRDTTGQDWIVLRFDPARTGGQMSPRPQDEGRLPNENTAQ